jgi:probable F420-dependent oxidoreductase
MDFGIVLPSIGDDSSRAGIEAAAGLAEEHGFCDVWGTDHLLVPHAAAEDYGRIYEIVTTLAWVAGRFRRVKLGTSVVVVPMRNAVVLAKELATIDALSEGRLIVGLGAGWNEVEFGNVGVADRFHVRGAYLEETIRLLRHLWSGSTEPFHGRFVAFEDFTFGPLPAQSGAVPIWLGGRSEKALERAGRLADAYHASATSPDQLAPRIPIIRAAAETAGRLMPRLSGRVRVELGGGPQDFYTLHGSPGQVAAEIRRYEDLGVDHLALAFPEHDSEGLRRSIERFVTEVRPLLG